MLSYCPGCVQIKRWAADKRSWAITSLYMTASNFVAAPTGSSTITRFLTPLQKAASTFGQLSPAAVQPGLEQPDSPGQRTGSCQRRRPRQDPIASTLSLQHGPADHPSRQLKVQASEVPQRAASSHLSDIDSLMFFPSAADHAQSSASKGAIAGRTQSDLRQTVAAEDRAEIEQPGHDREADTCQLAAQPRSLSKEDPRQLQDRQPIEEALESAAAPERHAGASISGRSSVDAPLLVQFREEVQPSSIAVIPTPTSLSAPG